jgi:hypothetical protein
MLQREHMSIVRRLDALDLFCFNEQSEEWAEIMAMCLAGIPISTAIEWCTAAEDRLPLEMIEGMAMSDLRLEFELARRLNLIVANSDAIEDLTWLAAQSAEVQAGYPEACSRIAECFEVLTPRTLKNQVLGIVAPPLVRNWASARPASTVAAPARGRKRSFRKSYSTTQRTVYARKRSSRYARRSYAR